jgi:hypothetical protein
MMVTFGGQRASMVLFDGSIRFSPICLVAADPTGGGCSELGWLRCGRDA